VRHRHAPLSAPLRFFCLALAGLLLFSQSTAFAQGWGEIRVAERLVNVRQSRNPNSPLVRALRPGEKVKVDFVQAGWGALFDVNEPERDETRAIGYADVRLLTPLEQSAKAAKTAMAPSFAADVTQIRYVESRTEIRKERSLKAEIVAVLAAGEHVQVGFPKDGFWAVFKMNDPGTDESSAIGYIPVGLVRVKERQPAAKSLAPAAPVKPVPLQPQGKSTPSPELKSEVKPEPKEPSSLLGKQPANSSQDPVRVTSDKMTYSQSGNSVVFLGNVHATQADMALWANKVTAYFTEKKKDPTAKEPADKEKGDYSDKIERIVAEGDVRMVSGKNEGACAQLTFFVQENLLRMDGNPVLREGLNTVRGDVIKFYVKENRSEVLSGKDRRVEAIFATPKSEKK